MIQVTNCFSAEKTADTKLQVLSKIYKVIALGSKETVLFPKDNKECVLYNFAYLAVNAKTRIATLFYHNVGDKIYT